MAKAKDGHWMEKAFEHASGQLRAKTHAKPGQPIPAAALGKAEHSSNAKTRKQANLAETARKIAKKGK